MNIIKPCQLKLHGAKKQFQRFDDQPNNNIKNVYILGTICQ